MATSAARAIRRTLAGLLLLALAALSGAAADPGDDPAPGASPKDKAKWRLAVQAAARQALDNLEAMSASNAPALADLAERLNTFMLQNASGCRTAEQGRQACWQAVRDVKLAEFQVMVSNAVLAAQEFSPLPLDSGALLAKLGGNWSSRVDTAIGVFLTNRFAAVYAEARGRAVALQRQAVEAAVRFPDQAELEARLGPLAERRPGARLEPADFQTLLPWLEGRSLPDPAALFEEVGVYLGGLSGRILEELKAQYAFQVGLPDGMAQSNAVPPARITADAIAREFQVAMDRAVAEARRARSMMSAVSNMPVYEVLEPARAYARGLARRLEEERALGFLRDSPVLAPAPDDLEAALAREPEAHRSLASSVKRFQADWAVNLRLTAAAEYVRQTGRPPRPDAEAAELRVYFEREFSSTSRVAVAFQKRVGDELARALPPLRERLAAAQFQRAFPALASDEPLSEAGIGNALDRKRAPARNPDQVAAFLEAAGLPAPSAADRRLLLDETGALAVGALNRKTADGCAAFDAQMALLRQVETNRLAQLEREVAESRPVEAILKDWTRALEQAWSDRPDDEAPGFPRLFARTRSALDKSVRQLYDDRRKQQQKAESAAAAAPASAATPSEGSPNTEVQVQPEEKAEETVQPVPPPPPTPAPRPDATVPEPEPAAPSDARAVADLALVFADAADGRCAVAWTVRDPAGQGEILFQPADIEGAVAAILAALQPDLDRVLGAKAAAAGKPRRSFLFFTRSAPAPDLRVAVSVKSRAVRHQMSLLLRQEIGRLAGEWAGRQGLAEGAVSLTWKVGL